jgi:hypothetical protein
VESLDEAAAVFTSLRPLLFGIAYRMLSSVTRATPPNHGAKRPGQNTTDRLRNGPAR